MVCRSLATGAALDVLGMGVKKARESDCLRGAETEALLHREHLRLLHSKGDLDLGRPREVQNQIDERGGSLTVSIRGRLLGRAHQDTFLP